MNINRREFLGTVGKTAALALLPVVIPAPATELPEHVWVSFPPGNGYTEFSRDFIGYPLQDSSIDIEMGNDVWNIPTDYVDIAIPVSV